MDQRPVNYCETGLHDCDISQRAQCIYTGGSSYTCSCLPGFSGDGRACKGAWLLWPSCLCRLKKCPRWCSSCAHYSPTSEFKRTSLSRKQQPTLVFLPGKSHGQRSLAGYNPWGHKHNLATKQQILSTLLSKQTAFCVSSSLNYACCLGSSVLLEKTPVLPVLFHVTCLFGHN